MYILEIIDASSLEASVKLNLRRLVEKTIAALAENEEAFKQLGEHRRGMNSDREMSRTVDDPGSVQYLTQIARLNLVGNSVYRVRGARRRLHELGHQLQRQIVLLDVRDSSCRSLAVVLKALIGKCVVAHQPSIRVARFERVESAVRAIFLQKRSGEGEFAQVNFSSAPIMVTETDCVELHVLYNISVEALKDLCQLSVLLDQFRATRSRLNAYRIFRTFADMVREVRRDQAEFYALANHAQALVENYRAKAARLEAAVKAAAATISDLPIKEKELAAASACLAGCNISRQMQMQLEIASGELDGWIETLNRVTGFDVDSYLAAELSRL